MAKTGVVDTRCKAKKRIGAFSSVAAGIAAVRRWSNGSSGGRKREPGQYEHERARKKTAPQTRAANEIQIGKPVNVKRIIQSMHGIFFLLPVNYSWVSSVETDKELPGGKVLCPIQSCVRLYEVRLFAYRGCSRILGAPDPRSISSL